MVFIGGLAALVLVDELTSIGAGSNHTLLIALVAILGVGAITYFWTGPRAARQQRRQLAVLRTPIVYAWTSDRLHAQGEGGTTDMAWADLWAWTRYRSGYLLYPSSRMHHIVPDRAFGSDAQEAVLRRALAEAGVPERRPFRRLAKRPATA